MLLLACDAKPADDAENKVADVPKVPGRVDELSAVCTGETFPAIPPRAMDALTRVAVFTRWSDSESDRFSMARTTEMKPTSLIPEWDASHATETGLVVCVERTATTLRETCNLSKGHTLELYDTKDHIRIIDPRDGSVVADEKVELENRYGCGPWAYVEAKKERRGTQIRNKVVAMMMEHQPSGTPVPEAPGQMIYRTVCGGLPNPAAPAYDAGAKDQGVFFEYSGDIGKPDGTYVRRESGGRANPLVACAHGTKGASLAKTCPFGGGAKLELWEGELEVELREVKTAKVVATETFSVSTSACPTMYSFPKGATVAERLGRVGKGFDAFIEEHGGTASLPK